MRTIARGSNAYSSTIEARIRSALIPPGIIAQRRSHARRVEDGRSLSGRRPRRCGTDDDTGSRTQRLLLLMQIDVCALSRNKAIRTHFVAGARVGVGLMTRSVKEKRRLRTQHLLLLICACYRAMKQSKHVLYCVKAILSNRVTRAGEDPRTIKHTAHRWL